MPPSAYPASLPALTSLRFFAAIWVVALHFAAWSPTAAKDMPLIVNGMLGVDFFFILSGFILTHAHIGQLRGRRLRLRPFLVRRLAKIYPMHLATLLFYLALVSALAAAGVPLPNPERYDPVQFALNLLLAHGWQAHDAGGWNYASWSVSAEWFAYLLFPLLGALMVRRLAHVPAGAMVVAAVALLLAFRALSPPLLGADFFALHSNFGCFRILPEFILGVALYRFGAERRLPPLESRSAVPLLVAAILVAAALDQRMAVVLASAALILAAAESARQARATLLDAPSLRYLGEVSYSIYMVHLPVATVMLQGGRLALGHVPLWMVLLAVPVTILVAVAGHRFIERPAHHRLLRFAEPRPPIAYAGAASAR